MASVGCYPPDSASEGHVESEHVDDPPPPSDGMLQQGFLADATPQARQRERQAQERHARAMENVSAFVREITGEVLDANKVRDLAALLSFVQSKGVEVIEGAIHNGIRGDHRLVWEPDGVSVVG